MKTLASLIQDLKTAIEFVPKEQNDDLPHPPPAELSNAEMACRTLTEFGETAKEALPELRLCTQQKGGYLRLEAAAAIWAISGDAEPAIRVASEYLVNLDWSPFDFMEGELELAIELLGKIGLPAASAIPLLKRASEKAPSAARRQLLVDTLAKVNGEK
jgi:hypothetical protein